MKRIFWFSMLLIPLLAACSSDGAGFECREGICISIEIKGPVQASVPFPFTVTVKTEEDMSDLAVGISVYPGDSIHDIQSIPKSAEAIYQDGRSLDWHINTISGEEYKFSGQVVFAKPTVSYGIFGHDIIIYASKPTIPRVTDSVTIYLDAEGNQVEENYAITVLQTEFPAPTPPPDLTIVPQPAMPTVVWPSATALPLSLPTQPAYPVPGENMNTEQEDTRQPTPTEVLPAYPSP